jgi:hypothetical protein
MNQESPKIKNLMVLWLVLTTEVGGEGSLYYSQLIDPDTGAAARAQLAQNLNLSIDIVNDFVDRTNSEAYSAQIADVQSLFHDLVSSNDPADYSGPECPHYVDAILGLLRP